MEEINRLLAPSREQGIEGAQSFSSSLPAPHLQSPQNSLIRTPMSDNASAITANNSAVIHQTSLCVYQAILDIQQQQPELLREKYRNVSWRNPRNQSFLLLKLKEGLSKSYHQELLNKKVHKFLQILLLPSYFELPVFEELMEKIRAVTQQLKDDKALAVGENYPSGLLSGALASPAPGIAILLLDVENLQLDVNTEKFLAGVCNYPIQIKIAFANWGKMGKQDVEFHRRGYELIHVPSGKDSADVKMATVGSSIFVHYPTAREVLVCSSDGVLTHLCTTLQTHGLTVYLVRKQRDTITVLNSQTNQTHFHSLKPVLEISPLEQFLTQLQELIKSEQEQTKQQWIKLARLCKLFQQKHNSTLSQIVSTHLPGKKAREIFMDYPSRFAVHQLSEQSELYVTLFEASPDNLSAVNHQVHPDLVNLQTVKGTLDELLQYSPSAGQSNIPPQTQPPSSIISRGDLEQFLVKIIQTSIPQSPEKYIPINTLGSQFRQQYGQSITAVIKALKLNLKFITFLKSCSVLELKQTQNNWSVRVR